MKPDDDLSGKPLIKIVCASILCLETSTTYDGVRHRFIKSRFVLPRRRLEGFKTNLDDFVTREEAWQIALKAQQIQPAIGQTPGTLRSEDLY